MPHARVAPDTRCPGFFTWRATTTEEDNFMKMGKRCSNRAYGVIPVLAAFLMLGFAPLRPIIGFVIGQKGLMFNLTLEGTKITKIAK